MGWKLVREVLDHAPDDLTLREHHALIVLANAARDDNHGRIPRIEGNDKLLRQLRLPDRSQRYRVLQALVAKGCLVRLEAGRPGYAAVYAIGPRLVDATSTKGSHPARPICGRERDPYTDKRTDLNTDTAAKLRPPGADQLSEADQAYAGTVAALALELVPDDRELRVIEAMAARGANPRAITNTINDRRRKHDNQATEWISWEDQECVAGWEPYT